jgi:heptosyltransferase-2
VHASRRLLDPLAPLLGAGIADAAAAIESVAEDVFLAPEEAEAPRALESLGYDDAPEGGFVAIHPGSGGRKKCWPAERFARLAVKVAAQGLTPLLLFGPADESSRREFEASCPPGVFWGCVAGRPLREVLAWLSCARCYVGNDSGITHLAARACPAVALFGPTDARVWAPLGKCVRIVRAPEGALDRLEVDKVAEEVQLGLGGQSAGVAVVRG